MDEFLVNTLKALAMHFEKNELAFLSLTTKIELPFRDRWSFLMHLECENDFIISREWKRTDIAVLKDQKPKALIELKAMYTFDAILKDDDFLKYDSLMDKDALKAKFLANEDTEIYTFLLATHPKKIIPKELERIVKYRQYINKAYKLFNNSEEIKSNALNKINEVLEVKNCIDNGCFDGGQSFGIDVDVYYWLLKI